ncbi:MAG TPA: TetR/AcrR family transcriptional regulator [Acidimicrobiia bacterium]|jgi:AcrR family transcriptional regulator
MTIDAATRGTLTRDKVIEAAVAFADEHGIEALSMRRLGHALGVEAMSLYNHVEDKDDLLDAMVDRVYREVATPAPSEDWKESVRATAISAKAAFVAHPWSVPLMTSRSVVTDSLLVLMDSMLETLLDAGFSMDTTHRAWHVISSHVMGYVLQEVGTVWGSDAQHEHDHSKLDALLRSGADRYRHVLTMVPYLMECSYDEEFEFGLDVILDGIEARRDG